MLLKKIMMLLKKIIILDSFYIFKLFREGMILPGQKRAKKRGEEPAEERK